MAITPVKTPFTNMSFTPDVPSSALSAAEYNSGSNIETDVRGIRKINGEEVILSKITGNVVYLTSGFRSETNYWMIAATTQGSWWALNSAGISNITPFSGNGIFSGYNANTAITSSWNGTVLFINDQINPPMYLLPTATELRLYDHAPDNYVWNYYSAAFGGTVIATRAGFMRLYNSPNLGSLLIAGNLTDDYGSGVTINYPTTVRWSQNFGLNAGPTTWAPTATNTANEVELPVRGPVIDGFPLNGNFYICSYWDTCILSPIAYQSSTVPVFGIKLLNQGRGLLNENCWVNTDQTVIGLDSRDIWSFDGGSFTPLGNQRVKNYFFANLNKSFTRQVFLVNNTQKNQVEIYYPDLTSTGSCNKMLSYRYDLNIWNPPRDVRHATAASESPIWESNIANLSRRGVVYASSEGNINLLQKDVGNHFFGNTTINSTFRRDNVSMGEPYSNSIQVHRILPELYGTGNANITVGGADSVGQTPAFKPTVSMTIDTSKPWVQVDQNANRVVSIQIDTNDNTDTWTCTAINWQVTVVEEDH